MACHQSLEHILEICVGLNAVEFARLDERADGCPPRSAAVGAGKQMILPSESYRTDCALDRVGIELDATIFNEVAELCPTIHMPHAAYLPLCRSPAIIRRLHDGPLGPYIDAYAARLVEQGLARGTGKQALRLIANLSRWLQSKGLDVDQLDEAVLRRYRRFLARTWPLQFGDPMALQRFLSWMRDVDICAPPPSVPLIPRAQVQADYTRYLSEVISLSPRTLEHYTEALDRFLTEQVSSDEPQGSMLTGVEVLRFFRRCAPGRSPQYLQRLRTALRSFLAGVDSTLIALWLGHESVETTQVYIHAHLALNEAALAKTTPLSTRPGRFKADDRLLQFLGSL